MSRLCVTLASPRSGCWAETRPARARPASRMTVRRCMCAFPPRRLGPHIVGFDVLVQDLEELWHDVLAPEGGEEPPVHVDRRFRLLGGAGQRDADVGVLRLAGTVHDAAHHGDLHLLHAAVALAPPGHLLAQVSLNAVGELLKEGARGASASGTRRDLRHEAAQAEALEDLLRDQDLLGPVTAGRG